MVSQSHFSIECIFQYFSLDQQNGVALKLLQFCNIWKHENSLNIGVLPKFKKKPAPLHSFICKCFRRSLTSSSRSLWPEIKVLHFPVWCISLLLVVLLFCHDVIRVLIAICYFKSYCLVMTLNRCRTSFSPVFYRSDEESSSSLGAENFHHPTFIKCTQLLITAPPKK